MLGVELVLDALAGDERLAVEVDAGGAGRVGDEQLLERSASPRGRWRRGSRVDGHVAPAERPRRPSSATIASIAACAFSASTASVGRNAMPDGVRAGRRAASNGDDRRAGSGRGPG